MGILVTTDTVHKKPEGSLQADAGLTVSGRQNDTTTLIRKIHNDPQLAQAVADLQSSGQIGEHDKFSLDKVAALGGMARLYMITAVSPQTGTACLGKGEFVIRSVKHIAVKVPNEREKVIEEEEAVAQELSLSAPAVVRYRPEYLCMEGLAGLNLQDAFIIIKDFPLPVKLFLMRKIAAAACELNERGISHGDIKPKNIILQPDGKVRLIDYGLAKKKEEYGSIKTVRGTPGYLPPEAGQGERHEKSDVFSLGMTFYELLHPQNKPMYKDEPLNTDRQQLLVNYLMFLNRLPIDIEARLKELGSSPPAMKTLLNQMLCTNTEKRIGIRAATEQLDTILQPYMAVYPGLGNDYLQKLIRHGIHNKFGPASYEPGPNGDTDLNPRHFLLREGISSSPPALVKSRLRAAIILVRKALSCIMLA